VPPARTSDHHEQQQRSSKQQRRWQQQQQHSGSSAGSKQQCCSSGHKQRWRSASNHSDKHATQLVHVVTLMRNFHAFLISHQAMCGNHRRIPHSGVRRGHHHNSEI
jgi:hypothetical protein